MNHRTVIHANGVELITNYPGQPFHVAYDAMRETLRSPDFREYWTRAAVQVQDVGGNWIDQHTLVADLDASSPEENEFFSISSGCLLALFVIAGLALIVWALIH